MLLLGGRALQVGALDFIKVGERNDKLAVMPGRGGSPHHGGRPSQHRLSGVVDERDDVHLRETTGRLRRKALRRLARVSESLAVQNDKARTLVRVPCREERSLHSNTLNERREQLAEIRRVV